MKTKNLILGGLVVAGAGAYFYFKNKGKKSLINSEVAPIAQSASVTTSSNKLSASDASVKALQAVSSPKLAPAYAQNHHDVNKMEHYNVLKNVFQQYNKEQVDKLVDIFPELLLSEGKDLTFEQQIFANDMDFSKKNKEAYEKLYGGSKIQNATMMQATISRIG
jgi:hypothetical protein